MQNQRINCESFYLISLSFDDVKIMSESFFSYINKNIYEPRIVVNLWDIGCVTYRPPT